MLLWIQLRLLSQLCLAFAAVGNAGRKSARPVKQKPINWNLSYYSEPFKLCKTLRKFNPVEQARVHGVATDIFRKCGPSLIVPYATKYQLPAFAIQKSGDFVCFICTFGSAYFGTYDAANVYNDTISDQMLHLLNRFCGAMERGNFSIKVKHRKQRFRIQAHMCHGFVYDAIECAIRKARVQDGEYAKYAVGHFMKMLL